MSHNVVGEEERKQIIELAVDRALKCGWSPIDDVKKQPTRSRFSEPSNSVSLILSEKEPEVLGILKLHEVIYNHEFAKSLWGEKEVHYFDIVSIDADGERTKTQTVTKAMWVYYLQQMVVSDDPIAYLAENM